MSQMTSRSKRACSVPPRPTSTIELSRVAASREASRQRIGTVDVGLLRLEIGVCCHGLLSWWIGPGRPSQAVRGMDHPTGRTPPARHPARRSSRPAGLGSAASGHTAGPRPAAPSVTRTVPCRMARCSVGLVLGAGGVVGGAYHAGALAALAEATGWDPRTRRSGRGHLGRGQHRRLAARRAVGRRPSGPGHRPPAVAGGGARCVGPDHGPRCTSTRRARGRAGPAVAAWLRRPRGCWHRPSCGPGRPAGAWRWPASSRPGGLRPAHRRPGPGHRDRTAGPTDPTWIVAYRTRDGRRVVFGRDDVDVPDLATRGRGVVGRARPLRARSASTSGRYLDGAVYSPTNADLVAGLGFDLVIVSSPMTAAAGAPSATAPTWPRGPGPGSAACCAREVDAVDATGHAGARARARPGRAGCDPAPTCPTTSWAPLVADAAHAAYGPTGREARPAAERLGSDA